MDVNQEFFKDINTIGIKPRINYFFFTGYVIRTSYPKDTAHSNLALNLGATICFEDVCDRVLYSIDKVPHSAVPISIIAPYGSKTATILSKL